MCNNNNNQRFIEQIRQPEGVLGHGVAYVNRKWPRAAVYGGVALLGRATGAAREHNTSCMIVNNSFEETMRKQRNNEKFY